MSTEIDAERILAATGQLRGGEYIIDRAIRVPDGTTEISDIHITASEAYSMRSQLEGIVRRAVAGIEGGELETLRSRLSELGVAFE